MLKAQLEQPVVVQPGWQAPRAPREGDVLEMGAVGSGTAARIRVVAARL